MLHTFSTSFILDNKGVNRRLQELFQRRFEQGGLVTYRPTQEMAPNFVILINRILIVPFVCHFHHFKVLFYVTVI